jgi:hypothetical protein
VSSLTERFFKTVGRHFVTLSCLQRRRGIAEERALVFSGFLVKAGGVWFYVTAGHILRDIRKSLARGDTFDVWRLDDQTAGNSFGGAAIPYAFEIERWLVVEDEEIGLDYAVVLLEPYYCQQLKAGRAAPIDKVAWGDHVAEHDYWALVGFPSESIAYDKKSIITGRISLMPLEPVAEPTGAGRKAENQFYARIKDLGNVTDIVGMSGGPIFSLKKVDGAWKYKVIGVQSGWYPDARIIAACPFASLGLELEKLVESAKASMQPSAGADAT